MSGYLPFSARSKIGVIVQIGVGQLPLQKKSRKFVGKNNHP
jgi:hypothetical protein